MTESSRFNPVEINSALCEALGLDPSDIKAVTIRLRANHVPTVEVQYGNRYVSEHPDLADALARFELVPTRPPVLHKGGIIPRPA